MNCRGVTVAAGAGESRRTPRPFCFLRTEEAEDELAGGKTASNRAWARGGPVRLAQVPTASSEKDAREKHSVGLGRQVPRAVRLPGEYTRLCLTTVQNGRPYHTRIPSATSPPGLGLRPLWTGVGTPIEGGWGPDLPNPSGPFLRRQLPLSLLGLRPRRTGVIIECRPIFGDWVFFDLHLLHPVPLLLPIAPVLTVEHVGVLGRGCRAL